ncbi:MAG: hypothetical protein ACRDOP_11250, partial [Gaiellaceae bacterium]
PLLTAERLRGALRPGGLLRICVPNGTDIRDRLRRGRWDDANRGSADSLMAVAPLEHVNCFNYRSLSGMARQAGLRETWFPARQFLDQWTPVRFVASSLMHKLRRPRGTLLLFEKA